VWVSAASIVLRKPYVECKEMLSLRLLLIWYMSVCLLVDDVALLTISIVQECRVASGIRILQFPSRLFRNATSSFGIRVLVI